MQTKYKSLTVALFALLFLTPSLGVDSVFATVGGPTVIYDFKYNPLDESVYYTKQDYSGRGCPPELVKLSLNSGISEDAYSCDEGEKLLTQDNNYDHSIVRRKIDAMTQGFKPLPPLSLQDSDISIKVTFNRAENYSPEFDEVLRRHFTATVYQNEVEVSEFPVTGCSLNQPFIFHGYSIPGFEKKLVTLLSTKGDCFEGGYINETLHMIAGVTNLNKTSASNFYKGPEVLIPNEDSLIVYRTDKGGDSNVSTPEQPRKTPLTTFVLIAVLFLILGIAVGKIRR